MNQLMLRLEKINQILQDIAHSQNLLFIHSKDYNDFVIFNEYLLGIFTDNYVVFIPNFLNKSLSKTRLCF